MASSVQSARQYHGPILVKVSVSGFAPTIEGFEPFRVHIERNPPIGASDVDSLVASDAKVRRIDDRHLEFEPATDRAMPIEWDGQCLTVPGLPEYFTLGSEYATWLKALARRLGACVHDDANAHWFIEPVAALGGIAPDGFHCHWIGRGSEACTRPL